MDTLSDIPLFIYYIIFISDTAVLRLGSWHSIFFCEDTKDTVTSGAWICSRVPFLLISTLMTDTGHKGSGILRFQEDPISSFLHSMLHLILRVKSKDVTTHPMFFQRSLLFNCVLLHWKTKWWGVMCYLTNQGNVWNYSTKCMYRDFEWTGQIL